MSNDINLCCCEFINENDERTHIIQCCCNCIELDTCVTRVIRCQRINMFRVLEHIHGRLRVPWRGGAKQLHFGTSVAVIFLPTLHVIAAQSLYMLIITFVLTALALYRTLRRRQTLKRRTTFFLAWTWACVVLVWLIFEVFVVPLLEILVEEHHLYNFFFFTAAISLYRTTTQSAVKRFNELDDNVSLMGTNESCAYCRAEIETIYCSTCRVTTRKYHVFSFWLDCCVSDNNRTWFFVFLVTATAALLYGGNLILTTVCEPFQFYKTILLPYDCSDVFEELDLAISYVCGVHTTILSMVLLVYLIRFSVESSHYLSPGHLRAIVGNENTRIIITNA